MTIFILVEGVVIMMVMARIHITYDRSKDVDHDGADKYDDRVGIATRAVSLHTQQR